jgi:tetratricopeptide (TPR) repeat protein
MSSRHRPLALAIAGLALLVVSAGQPSSDDLVRAANDAYDRGDLDGAEALYQQAEERAADPGLVAFNKGTVLYRRGDVRRAELCFRRTLGDAAIPADRRARALSYLGNCLVRQAGETDVRLLQAAIDCFELAVRETADEGVRSDAGHNLEVAKLLWAKARTSRPPGERDPDWEEPRPPRDPPPDPKKQPEDADPDGTGDGPKEPKVGPKLDGSKGPEAGKVPKETQKAVPGAGNLPVIPDNSEKLDLTPEDARAHLRRHADRIHRERQKLREEATLGDRPRANDW